MSGNVLNNVTRGDCLKVMKHLPDQCIDMVLADLPYGTTASKWDQQLDFKEFWIEINRITKLTSACVLTASQPFTSLLLVSNISQFKHEWIWIKNRGSNFANTVREPFKEHESVLVFAKSKWVYNKQMQQRSGGGIGRVLTPIKEETHSENYGKFSSCKSVVRSELRVPSSWQKFNTEVGLHPTQKPVALFEYLIKTYTNPNAVILDPCAGSGTTGVAARNTGRNFILIEKEQKYVDTIRLRLDL